MSEIFEVKFEGRTYKVTYSVADKMITVRVASFSKSTQVGGSAPNVLASIMANEMLIDASLKGLL